MNIHEAKNTLRTAIWYMASKPKTTWDAERRQIARAARIALLVVQNFEQQKRSKVQLKD